MPTRLQDQRMAKSKKETGLIGQLKEAIQASGKSLYRLGKESTVGPDRLSRFMRGERSLTLDAAEKLCDVLRLKLVPVPSEQAEAPEAAPKKRRPRRPNDN
jgi:hypothetical protein